MTGAYEGDPVSPIYLAQERTLSRVDLSIESLPWEIQPAHCCKKQSKQSYLSVEGITILFTVITCC